MHLLQQRELASRPSRKRSFCESAVSRLLQDPFLFLFLFPLRQEPNALCMRPCWGTSWAIENCPQEQQGFAQSADLRLRHRAPPRAGRSPADGGGDAEAPPGSLGSAARTPVPRPRPRVPARRGPEASRLPGHAAYRTGPLRYRLPSTAEPAEKQAENTSAGHKNVSPGGKRMKDFSCPRSGEVFLTHSLFLSWLLSSSFVCKHRNGRI